MAKYVQPNFIVDSSASFLRNVTFDSSVYLQGVTHISSPVASSTSLNTLVVDSIGSDVQIKYRTLGTMALQTAASYDASLATIRTDIDNLESSVGVLDLLTQKHEASIGVHTSQIAKLDASVGVLTAYEAIQDSSISKVWQRWIDTNRTGFLNQTETTLSFNDSTGVFSVVDAGSGWSYYRGGVKYTISGAKTVTLPGGGSAPAGTYYITIEDGTGALTVSTTVWSLSGQTVLVAYIIWDPANTPKYWMGEERHTILIDRRMHQYLHTTQGTKFVSGGTLTGPGIGGTTDASNAFGVAATTIADEDIFQTLPVFTRPANPLSPGNEYLIFYRTAPTTWSWKTEDTPLPESGSYIEWDNNGTLQAGITGKFYNTYLAYTNISGKARYAIIPGRGQYDTAEDAANENIATFDFTGLPAKEFVLAWQFIWSADTLLTTRGKVNLSVAPLPVNVNLTTASAPASVDHNNLLGLQGGSAAERYHLTLAQWQDYAGKSYIDASLGVRDNRLNNHDTSIAALDTLTQTHTAQILTINASLNVQTAWNTQQDASITAIKLVNTNQDTSIAALDVLTQSIVTKNTNQDTSIAALDTLTQSIVIKNVSQDASIVGLRSYDAIQDASIALSVAGTTKAWNGLTRTDNSIGLGGTLNQNTDINTNGKLLSVTGGMSIFGTLTVDGSVTYVNSVDLNVSDNMITLNYGEDASGVSKGFAGIKIDRGIAEFDYVFAFEESSETFRVGLANEAGFPLGTQAVATRQDAPELKGVAVWNTTDRRFDTFAGLKYDSGFGLTTNKLAITNPGATVTEDTALFLLPDGSVATRDLGTMAFATAADFATKLYVDGSLAVQTAWNNQQDASIVALRLKNTNQDTSIAALDALTQTHTSQIATINASLNVNSAKDAAQDASIIRIDASLNDTIEALDLFYGKTYIDGSFGARDTSIAWLNSNKVNKAGDTMTGALVFAAAGFTLDGQSLTDIDTSGNLTALETHLPTSAAVKSYVDTRITEGVNAWNGLTETDNSIGLGGVLSTNVVIDISTHTLTISNLVLDANEQTVVAVGDAGNLVYTELGTMAFQTSAAWDASLTAIRLVNTNQDTSIASLDTLTQSIVIKNTNQDTSIANLSTLTQTQTALLAVHEASIGSLTTRVNNHDTSIAGLDTLTRTHTTQISNMNSSIGALDTLTQSIVIKNTNQDTSIASLDTLTQSIVIKNTNQDTSIASLDTLTQNIVVKNTNQDISINNLYIQNATQDASIVRIDASIAAISSNALKTASNGLTAAAQNVKLGGTLSEDTIINTTSSFAFGVIGNMAITGNLTVDGSVTYVNTVQLNVSDNIIEINAGLTGTPSPTMVSGMKVNRGVVDPYFFIFSEADDTFRIGSGTEGTLPLGTQAVATRQDSPVVSGVGYWNDTAKRIDTSAGFTFVPGTGLSLPIATVDNNEFTALLITPAGLVVSKELGTGAFATIANYATLAYVDGSIAARDVSIARVAAYAADVSANKLSAVATVSGIGGGHEVYSVTSNNTAYIKKILAGTGATIISDTSTITISVSGAAGYVSKYTGTFNGTSGTSLTVAVGTHGLGVGPFNITVYDGTQLVYVDADVDGSGNVTFNWSSGSLSASCKYIISG